MKSRRGKAESPSEASAEALQRVRLDKWLWAARLFKTRALAKQAIEGGKISADNQKLKPGKEIGLGTVLTVRQGWDEKVLLVKGLSEQRRGAPEARLLYEETPESIRKREELSEQRKLQAAGQQAAGKPDKKDRRLRSDLKHWDWG